MAGTELIIVFGVLISLTLLLLILCCAIGGKHKKFYNISEVCT